MHAISISEKEAKTLNDRGEGLMEEFGEREGSNVVLIVKSQKYIGK